MTQRSRSLKRYSCHTWAAKREVECDMIPKQDLEILYKHGTGICLGIFSYQRRELSYLINWMTTRQWPVL